MTNRELLAAPKETLGAVERQKQYVLRIELTPVPCPACQAPVNVLEAAGLNIDAYQFDKGEPDYSCPHCQAQLEQIVPALGGVGPGWHWALKHSWLAAMLAKAWAYDRDNQPQRSDRPDEP